jgi:hypothetical protein
MASLTLRLDDQTDALLTHYSEVLHQTKSTLARAAIGDYLKAQQAKEAERAALLTQIGLDSKEAVALRVAESQAAYRLTEAEYAQALDEFFAKELGLIR